MSDLDSPPASDDPNIQNFLSIKWREALRATREGLESIREVYPELTHHLPETAERHLYEAMRGFEKTAGDLHRAGRHVLGEDEYNAYLEAQTQRKIGDDS